MVEENVTCVQCNDVCSGDVVSVQGRYYHQYCFTCKNCGIDLLKHGYFFLHNEFYCNEDYHLISGTLCSGCGKVADGDLVSALGALFHVDCFGCTRCGKLFPPGVEITFNGEDYMCENCSQPVANTKRPASPPETSNQYESRDRSPPPYHSPADDPRIDTIDASQAPKIDPPYESPHHSPSPPRRHSPPPYERSPRIESPLLGNISPTRNASPPSPEKPRSPPLYKPVQPRDVTPLTENGDVLRDKRDTPRSNRSEASDSSMSCCAGCGNDIKSGQALLALEKQWHLWCFTCYKCGCLLAGEYMGRDGVPYCEQDYQSEFGVCCAGCGGYITGKVLQAGEKHYHPQCSRCAKCQQMFGEGEEMYLQGSEIWHPDCSEEYQKEQEEEEKRKAAEEEERQFRPSPRQSSTNTTRDILDIDELLSDIKISDYKPADKPQRQPIFNPHINSVKTTVSVNKQQQPPPYNVKSRPTGFRSIRPPGADDPPASPVAVEDDESPPPVPPPPTRSSSTSWKSKYNSGVYSAQPFRKPSETSPVNETPSSRPSSSLYRPVNVPSLETEKEEADHAPSRASNTNEEHYSTQNGLSPEQKAQQAAANYKKGKGVNRLQMRIANKPDVKPANNSPPGDQQVSTSLQRNKRMSYLSDREFFDVFEMGREKFNTLPKWKQEDLKKAAFLF